MTAKLSSMERSKGHVAWLVSDYYGTTRELYQSADGELYIASDSSVLDIMTGNRQGRWEAPIHMVESTIANLREVYGDGYIS